MTEDSSDFSFNPDAEMMESLRLGLDGTFLGLDTGVADGGEEAVSVVAVVGSAFERVEVEFLLPGRKYEGGVSKVSRHCGSTMEVTGKAKPLVPRTIGSSPAQQSGMYGL